MIRLLIAAIALSCLSTSASTQTQSSPPASGPQATKPLVKPTARKPAEKKESQSKPAPATSDVCGLGVIVSVGDEFMVKKLKFFNDDETMVPIESWGLNDLVFARVRAPAPPGVTVRRVPYTKSPFPPREELKNQLF